MYGLSHDAAAITMQQFRDRLIASAEAMGFPYRTDLDLNKLFFIVAGNCDLRDTCIVSPMRGSVFVNAGGAANAAFNIPRRGSVDAGSHKVPLSVMCQELRAGQLEVLIPYCVEALSRGEYNIVVHCASGFYQAPLAFVALARRWFGLDAKRAMRLLGSKRIIYEQFSRRLDPPLGGVRFPLGCEPSEAFCRG